LPAGRDIQNFKLTCILSVYDYADSFEQIMREIVVSPAKSLGNQSINNTYAMTFYSILN